MLKRYALVGLLIGLAACSSPPQRLSPEALTRIKKVAVMSLVAHEFHRQYVGFTAFGNELTKHDIVSGTSTTNTKSHAAALVKLARSSLRVPYERDGFTAL